MCREETRKEKVLPYYSLDDIRKHASREDRWIVIDDLVYDVTSWGKMHPGGEKLISNHAGEDATDAWVAFHNDRKAVSKYLRPLLVGKVREEERKVSELIHDFRDLRQKVEDMGLFKASVVFFTWTVGQVIALEALAWLIFWQFGTSWVPYLVATLLLTTAQAQAGWSQHDFGHLSVFNSSRWNHILHVFIINFLKGASSDWWNYRHFQHHAKPNVVRKDPDIRLDYILLVGDKLPVEWGKRKKGAMPYHHQHQYFYFIMPPLLLPLYFNFEIPYFLISRGKWAELFWMGTFFLRWHIIFSPFISVGGIFALFFFVRFFESHWFVWTTQMNHIPMEVDKDHSLDWVTMQLQATCNVDQSAFNDWFSGHLNFQIEHHLFPTMPRHNYHKVAPLCKSLCEKHGLKYESKPLFKAFSDIIGSLKRSGKLWYEAYHM
ncbi:acyl-CoA (8-3)-desaturase-like [Haliotis cracherodii]|uniref:acyl-CoA (8-3)-desaturase-like n=1 Tax=Haliotis cracherodii TaxID=6455 RepID=UPI0039EBF7AB